MPYWDSKSTRGLAGKCRQKTDSLPSSTVHECETVTACWPCPNAAHSPTTTVVTTAFCRWRVQSLTTWPLQASNSCSLPGQESCFRNPNSLQGSWGGALSLSPTNSADNLRQLRGTFPYDQERQRSRLTGTDTGLSSSTAALPHNHAHLTEGSRKLETEECPRTLCPARILVTNSVESLSQRVLKPSIFYTDSRHFLTSSRFLQRSSVLTAIVTISIVVVVTSVVISSITSIPLAVVAIVPIPLIPVVAVSLVPVLTGACNTKIRLIFIQASPSPSNTAAVQAYLHLSLELFQQILPDFPTAAAAGTVPLTWLLLFHTGNGKLRVRSNQQR